MDSYVRHAKIVQWFPLRVIFPNKVSSQMRWNLCVIAKPVVPVHHIQTQRTDPVSPLGSSEAEWLGAGKEQCVHYFTLALPLQNEKIKDKVSKRTARAPVHWLWNGTVHDGWGSSRSPRLLSRQPGGWGSSLCCPRRLSMPRTEGAWELCPWGKEKTKGKKKTTEKKRGWTTHTLLDKHACLLETSWLLEQSFKAL